MYMFFVIKQQKAYDEFKNVKIDMVVKDIKQPKGFINLNRETIFL